MKNGKALLVSAFLSLTLVFTSQAAVPGTQGGGVPSLDARVSTLEVTVADQGTAGADLQTQVNDLQSQLSGVQDELLTLQSQLPKFAVVEADATLRASRGVQSVRQSRDGSGNLLTGHYEVFFDRNVSRCAVTVTAEPVFSGGITASVNGTLRGIPNPTLPDNGFIIVLSDDLFHRVNSRFNVIVTC